jgi:hypothetical protein
MGHKVRHLFGCSALFRDAILIFTLVACADKMVGGSATMFGLIGDGPPPGYLQVTVDAPDSVKSDKLVPELLGFQHPLVQ